MKTCVLLARNERVALTIWCLRRPSTPLTRHRNRPRAGPRPSMRSRPWSITSAWHPGSGPPLGTTKPARTAGDERHTNAKPALSAVAGRLAARGRHPQVFLAGSARLAAAMIRFRRRPPEQKLGTPGCPDRTKRGKACQSPAMPAEVCLRHQGSEKTVVNEVNAVRLASHAHPAVCLTGPGPPARVEALGRGLKVHNEFWQMSPSGGCRRK